MQENYEIYEIEVPMDRYIQGLQMYNVIRFEGPGVIEDLREYLNNNFVPNYTKIRKIK